MENCPEEGYHRCAQAPAWIPPREHRQGRWWACATVSGDYSIVCRQDIALEGLASWHPWRRQVGLG